MSMTFHCETPNGLVAGPNFSNSNCAMIVRALGLKMDPDEAGCGFPLMVLEAACLLSLAVPPIEDDGQSDIETGGPGTGQVRMIDCGVRPGYFADAYGAILEFVHEAKREGATREQEIYAC